jgi:7-cyano-7-deazaguanine synthase
MKQRNPGKAIVLVSGGMDSAVCAGLEASTGPKPAFIHFNYGQRTQKKESECFRKLAAHYGVKEKLVVDLAVLLKIGGSTLLKGHGHVPKASFHPDRIPSTYVPFRNGIMLSFAAAWAEVTGASRLVIGAVEEDSSGYPDCRRSFINAFSRAVALGTKKGVKLHVEAPLVGMTKEQIAGLGNKLCVPFDLTWSCYSRNTGACGVCESCLLRLKGFKAAGLEDPVKYVGY